MQEFRGLNLKNTINVSQVITIYYYEFIKSFEYKGEKHNFWEMVYVDKGEVIITANHEKFILKQGEVVFHKPNEFHSIKANKITAPNVFIISFVCKSPAMKFFEGRRMFLHAKLRDIVACIVRESVETFETVGENFIQNPLTYKKDAVFGGIQLIKNYLEQLLVLMIRSGQSVAMLPVSKTVEDAVVNDVMQLLGKNIYGKIDMNAICQKVHYGKTYLSTKFKSETGYSIMEYYSKLKIAEAKKLIRERNYNIAQIANMLMFSDPHYFSRVFKRHTGMTPKEYLGSVIW